jgi:hypothetical protein
MEEGTLMYAVIGTDQDLDACGHAVIGNASPVDIGGIGDIGDKKVAWAIRSEQKSVLS